MQTSCNDISFISKISISYWKDGTVKCASHEASSIHQKAIQVIKLPDYKLYTDIREMLPKQHSDIKENKQEMLIKDLI